MSIKQQPTESFKSPEIKASKSKLSAPSWKPYYSNPYAVATTGGSKNATEQILFIEDLIPSTSKPADSKDSLSKQREKPVSTLQKNLDSYSQHSASFQHEEAYNLDSVVDDPRAVIWPNAEKKAVKSPVESLKKIPAAPSRMESVAIGKL